MESEMSEPNRPFYYTSGLPLDGKDAIVMDGEKGCYLAPSGWYQETPEGLKYLGESILDSTGTHGGE
jgi:hypothetical protein